MYAQLPTREHPACFTVRSIANGQTFGPAYANVTDATRHAAIGLALQPSGFEIVHETCGLYVVVAVVRPERRYPA